LRRLPARRSPLSAFGDYFAVLCGMIRRYGLAEPIIRQALFLLLRKLRSPHRERGKARGDSKQVALMVLDAKRKMAQPDDFLAVQTTAEAIGYAEPITL
jgi:uncharacterized membrane protein